MDYFVKTFTKLAQASDEKVQDSDLTYAALNQRCATIIKAGDFPNKIAKKKTVKPVPQQVVVEAPAPKSESAEEENYVAPDEAADMAADFDDAFASDSDEAPPVKKEAPAPKKQEHAEDAAIEVIEDADGNKQEEEKVQDGDNSGHHQRRERGDRGDRGGKIYRNRGGPNEEGGDRGNYRGNRGNNRRGRPSTGYKKANEDDEGFNVVQDKNTESRGRRRPRGRGNYRGGEDRGGRGGEFHRGGEGYYRGRGRGGDGEGSGRGDRGRGGRGRGERPPRK